MPLRAIKHQLTCPFEITSCSFLIGRRPILVIPRNHLEGWDRHEQAAFRFVLPLLLLFPWHFICTTRFKLMSRWTIFSDDLPRYDVATKIGILWHVTANDFLRILKRSNTLEGKLNAGKIKVLRLCKLSWNYCKDLQCVLWSDSMKSLLCRRCIIIVFMHWASIVKTDIIAQLG